MTGPVVACTVWLPSTVMAGSMTRVETAPRLQHRSARRQICGVQDLLPLLGADEVGVLFGRFAAVWHPSTSLSCCSLPIDRLGGHGHCVEQPATGHLSTTELGAEPTNLTAAEAK
jgi:hypothetical protein